MKTLKRSNAVSVAVVTSLVMGLSNFTLKAEGATLKENANTVSVSSNAKGTTANAEDVKPKWGDSNLDGDVGIADAVLVLQTIAKPDVYQLNANASKWADVYMTGDGITASDALSIQKYVAKVLDELPESYSELVATTPTTLTTRTTVMTTTSAKTTNRVETTTTSAKTTSRTETTTMSTKTTGRTETTTTSARTTSKTQVTSTSTKTIPPTIITTVNVPTATKTSTTKAVMSTTKTTTVTTTTARTTTTTTTTKATTTTTATTAKQTSTTSTMPKEEIIACIRDAVDDLTIKDTIVPPYNGEFHEDREHVFLTKIGNTKYAYTMLSDADDPKDAAEIIYKCINELRGIHMWIYKGKEEPVTVNDSLPDTTGLKFTAYSTLQDADIESKYYLKQWSKFSYVDILYLYWDILDAKRYRDSNLSNTQHYDYNLSGNSDLGDAEIMIKYWASDLCEVFWANQGAFKQYTDFLKYAEQDNFVMIRTKSTEPVMYAYNIPTGAKERENMDNIWTSNVPVQVLPQELAEEVNEYVEEDDGTYGTSDTYSEDYYVLYDKYSECWSKMDKADSVHWSFCSGIYVYVLNADGKYQLEWIK